MSEERLNRIKENVYARRSIANITGIGMTAPDKEEVELIEEIERLNNIINELEKWAEDYRFANIFKDKLQELKKGTDKE